MLSKINQKIILLFVFFSLMFPVFYIPTVQAGEYANYGARIQVITTNEFGWWLGTIDLLTEVQSYSPYPDGWRILHYTSYVQKSPSTFYRYDILDIDWYTYRARIGIILAGSIWRIKFYDVNNEDIYFIFDLKAYVYAWGSTVVSFTPVESSDNDWTHTAYEVNMDGIFWGLGIWLDCAFQKYP